MKNSGKNGKLGSKIQVGTRAWKTLNRFCFCFQVKIKRTNEKNRKEKCKTEEK